MSVIKQAPDKRHTPSSKGVVGIGIDPDTRAPACSAVWVPCVGPPVVLGAAVAKRAAAEVRKGDAVMWSCQQVRPLVSEVLKQAWKVDDMPKSFAIESQLIYQRDRARTEDIINLAQVAGAILAFPFPEGSIVLRATPQEWKGSVPKDTHQARVCKRLGWACRLKRTKKEAWCVPTDAPFKFTDYEWADVLDAIGLGLWAADTTS